MGTDSAPATGGQWLKPREAVLPDETCRGDSRLAALLMQDGLALCNEVPAAVAELCLKYAGARQLSPALVRTHLKSNCEHPTLSLRNHEQRTEVCFALYAHNIVLRACPWSRPMRCLIAPAAPTS